jgi:type VI protein secretion system component Hcp
MARGTSSRHAGWCLALLLSGALAPARAQAPQDDFSGAWGSNFGLTYTITQSGSQVSWKDSAGVVGTIVWTASGLSTTWSDTTGQHSATGTIVERDSGGRPTKIAWSNGVVMQRAAPFAAQIAKPAYQVAPVAPPPKAVQAVPNVQGVQLPGTTVLASTIPLAQGGQALFIELPEIEYTAQDARVPLRSASLHLEAQPQGSLKGDVPVMLISKDIDRTSPKFLDFAGAGRVFPLVVLTVVVNIQGQPRNLMTCELVNVRILSYSTKIPAESGVASAGVEELTLQFNEITYEVKTSGPAGPSGPTVTGTYKAPGLP